MAKVNHLLASYRRFKATKLGEILAHARNYFVGDVATKALGFISMPVFTRLMSEEDYGVVAVYTATLGLLGTIVTLNTTDGISRYYYEKDKGDFGEFLSSIIQFVLIIHILMMVCFLVFKESIMNWLELPTTLIYFLLIGLFYGLVSQIFSQVLISRKLSRPYVRINVVQAYGGFSLSWLLLMIGSGTQYILRITGFTLMQFLSAIWIVVQFHSYVIWRKINWQHIQYSLKFSLPRLPYMLSGVILSQFDRIMLSNMISPAEAGLYSVGYNVGGLSLLVIGAITPALLPDFYQLMNDGKHKQIDRLNRNLMWITTAAGIFLMVTGGTLLRLLADKRFHEGAIVIPAVVVGYMFYSLAGVYNRFSGYYKMTLLQSIGALVAGGINILLNYLWIPRFGFLAAAYVTVIAYACQALLTWMLVAYFAKGHVTSIASFFWPMLVVLFVFLMLMIL